MNEEQEAPTIELLGESWKLSRLLARSPALVVALAQAANDDQSLAAAAALALSWNAQDPPQPRWRGKGSLLLYGEAAANELYKRGAAYVELHAASTKALGWALRHMPPLSREAKETVDFSAASAAESTG